MSRLVAVTGASGFIGRAAVARLIADDWRVRALVRRPTPDLEQAGVSIVAGDLENGASLCALVADADVVVHCAGAVRAARPEIFDAVNAGGTARLLDAVRCSGATPRVVLISSLAAREPQLSPYAASKLRSERMLAAAPVALDWCILRLPAVYGPGDRATLTLFRQLERGFALVPAGGRQRFSLLHVNDLAAALSGLLAGPVWGRSMHELDDGRTGGYGWADIADLAGRALGRRIRRIPVPRSALWLPAAAGEAYGRLSGRPQLVTPGKLRELFHVDWVSRSDGLAGTIDWTPRIGFEQGFAVTYAWYKRQGWL